MADEVSPLPNHLLPSGPPFNYGALVDKIALAVADRDPRTGALVLPAAGDLPRHVAELKAEIEQLRRDRDAGPVGQQAMKARAGYPITGLWLRTLGTGASKRVQVLVEHDGYWRIAIDEHVAGEIGHIVELGGLTRLDVLENLRLPPRGRALEERGDAKSEADTVLAELEQAKLTIEDIARAAGMAMWTDGKHARAALVDLVGQLRRLGTHAELTEVTHERDSARTERDEARAWIERYRPEIEKLRGRTNEPASLTLAELQAEAARANDAQGVIAFLGGVLARLRKERSIEGVSAIIASAELRMADARAGKWWPNPSDDPADWVSDGHSPRDDHNPAYKPAELDSEVSARCGDRALSWAEAFCTTHGGDVGLMIAWFAAAIEESHVVRIKRAEPEGKLSASEALYGFAGWLTTRPRRLVLSAKDDAGPVAELVRRFCEENNLTAPRDGWSKLLSHPAPSKTDQSDPPPILTREQAEAGLRAEEADGSEGDPLDHAMADALHRSVTGIGHDAVVDLDKPPDIERYVLATVDIPGGEVFAGLAYEEADGVEELREELREALVDVSGRSHVLRPGPVSTRAAKFINAAFETWAATAWPGRAWFVEVWDEREALTQMYAPWGRPRWR